MMRRGSSSSSASLGDSAWGLGRPGIQSRSCFQLKVRRPWRRPVSISVNGISTGSFARLAREISRRTGCGQLLMRRLTGSTRLPARKKEVSRLGSADAVAGAGAGAGGATGAATTGVATGAGCGGSTETGATGAGAGVSILIGTSMGVGGETGSGDATGAGGTAGAEYDSVRDVPD